MLAPTRWSRFTERLTRALSARRRWTHGAWHIRQKHIFIIPNRFGLYAGFLVLASFAMGYKVQNNFILLAVIFLFLVFMLSLIASVRNLQGLSVTAHLKPYYFAGDIQAIELRFQKNKPAFNVFLESGFGIQNLDLLNGACRVLVPVSQHMRGVYTVAPVKLRTSFPFGIATTWSWLLAPGELVVGPKPHEHGVQLYPRGHLAPSVTEENARQERTDFADEPGDLRDYEPSDLPSRIDWKRYAACREVMVRDHGHQAHGALVLRQPTGGLEVGLSYLAGGLRVAERLGVSAHMILNGADYLVYDRTTRERAFYALARAT